MSFKNMLQGIYTREDSLFDESISMDLVCDVCGHRYGSHVGSNCPDREEWRPATTKAAMPQKKLPGLPAEVWHTAKFDKDEAWKAIIDLSRGN